MVRPDINKFFTTARARTRRLSITCLTAALLLSPLSSLGAPMDDANSAIRLQDYAKAAKILQTLSASGDADAQYQLAALYRSGRGVGKDHQTAFELLKSAAQQGHLKAKYNLASMYENGWGTTADLELARQWYEAAAKEGHALSKRKLEALQNRIEELQKSLDEMGTPFIRAAAANDQIKVRQLIQAGMDIDYRDKAGRTALYESVIHDNLEITRLLLEQGASTGIRDNLGDTPLIAAVKLGLQKQALTLLEQGADIDATDPHGNTPLIIAAGKGDAGLVKLLLRRNAKVNQKNDNGDTALYLANQRKQTVIAEALQQKGAIARQVDRVDRRDFTRMAILDESIYAGWPLINIAALRGELDGLKRLIGQGDSIESVAPDGHTPLYHAVVNNHPNIVEYLLGLGANPNHLGADSISMLQIAAQQGKTDMVRYLLASAVDIDHFNSDGETALFIAVKSGNQAISQLLLEHGAKPDIVNRQSTSPLMVAARNGDARIIRQLLAMDANRGRRDLRGYPAIWYAVESGSLDTVKLLSSEGNSIDFVSDKNDTLLMKAIESKQPEIFDYLLTAGLDPAHTNDNANDALHLAAGSGMPGIIRRLLEHNAALDVNRRNRFGNTPLMLAAERGDSESVQILLQAGANPLLRNTQREQAIDKARNKGHLQVAEMLQQSMESNSSLLRLFQ